MQRTAQRERYISHLINFFKIYTHGRKVRHRSICTTNNELPSRILWKAVSTLVESKAEVSINESPSFSANPFASSVGTDRKCLRSDLLPENEQHISQLQIY